MNIWKSKDELAKHGRNGDTMMKKIDGDLAHVNPVEYEMSPKYIKEHGAGTINPITGKKEYQLGALSTGLAIGGSILKGFGAMGVGKDVAAGKTAAYDIYQDQLGLLGSQLGVSEQTAELGFDVAQSQYTGGVSDVTMGRDIGVRNIEDASNAAMAQSNLVTSGTIESKAQTQTGDLMEKYKSDIQKLVETRAFSERERDISLNRADLAFRSGEMSAEDAYQSTLIGLEAQPTTFLEGMFG